MDYLYLWLLVMTWTELASSRRAPTPGTCTYSKVYSMFGADCSGINLVSIPSTINKKIEVLDASVNRIRVLKNNSFEGLSYLRYLYLADNPIAVIEGGAFLELTELEVLDLSLNAIRTLPALLPPTLRKLYLSENPLMEVPLGEAVGLQFVTLADSFLQELPRLGELPNLLQLNISGNPMRSLNVTQLASFCNLQQLVLPVSLTEPPYTTSCECARVSLWALEHSIQVRPPFFNCTIDVQECEMNSTEESEAFNSCQVAYQKQAATHYLVIVAGALGFLVCASVLTVLWTRRRKPRASSQQPQTDLSPTRQTKLLPDSTVKPRF